MRSLYPQDPHFTPLVTDINAPAAQWGEFSAHDPSLIEEGGVFYAFSTGNRGENNYQIRRSADLIHWEYVGQPFPQGIPAEATRELEAAYGAAPRNFTLWAPDVVRGADGRFWLYGCYTAVFGDNYSVIFLARAEEVCGPYEYAATLVISGGRWGRTPNAIDPQIFYDGDRMYMTYGSFFGGIRILELDPATGLRKDGRQGAALRRGTDAARYGKCVLYTENAEGSVVHVARSLPLWLPFGEGSPSYADRFILMASCDNLAKDYSMREWSSDKPDRGYEVPSVKLSSSCTWRREREKGPDFFAPGHNDIFTSSDGRMFVACHNRIRYGDARRHYLLVMLAAFNGAGQLVFSFNRYAGERLRTISRGELVGDFSYIPLDAEGGKLVHARGGLSFAEDGSVLLNGERAGRWGLYGDYFVDFTLGSELYRGAAMPAWLEREGCGGITISAIGAGGYPVYLNGVRG